MPITRRQFEIGIDSTVEDWMKRIHSFLNDHKDEAFTIKELKLHLLGEEPEWSWEKSEESHKASSEYRAKERIFDAALEKLVELGAAYEKEILTVKYYSVGAEYLWLN